MQITDPIADLLTRNPHPQRQHCQTPFRGRSCFQPEEGDLPDPG